jgi:hypothetical protein
LPLGISFLLQAEQALQTWLSNCFDQLLLASKLEEEKSLTNNNLTLDDPPALLPAKQRVKIGIRLQYSVDKDFGPSDTTEDRPKRRKAIADYMLLPNTLIGGSRERDHIVSECLPVESHVG